MIELATAIKVVSLVNSSFDLLDNVVSSWKKYVKTGKAKQSSTTSYSEKVRASDDNHALVHSLDGRVSKKITIKQLKSKLSETDAGYISAVESRMELNVKRWNNIVKKKCKGIRFKKRGNVKY